jgi:hypothetical protein
LETGWGSRGSKYNDLYDGRPVYGRLETKVTKLILGIEDSTFKALPTVAKNKIIFCSNLCKPLGQWHRRVEV